MSVKRKSGAVTVSENVDNGFGNRVDLFVDKPASDLDQDESDSSDSEESQFSGLEEEPDTTDQSESELEEDSNEEEEKEPKNDSGSESEDENGNGVQRGSADKAVASTSHTDSHTGGPAITPVEDEYQEDSSDEEDVRNTVGNIPMEWYRDYPHIGYDVEGNKLIKPKKGDHLDEFLNKMDDPNYWRTVTNKLTGQNVLLSENDLKLVQRLQARVHPTGQDTTHQPWIDFFTYEPMIHPLTNHPAQKRSFIPSKWEKLKVGQMVHAIKMGWMKPQPPKTEHEEDQHFYYNLWKDEDEPEINKRFRQHIPAPKMLLPGHEESYNPPPEYLPTEEEAEQWKEQELEDRRLNFLPKSYSSLRLVPAYPRFMNERFERCLDLYLCPRQQKMRMNVNPEDLLPKLPKPRDLQPFPTQQALVFRGHTGMVRCIGVAPTGQWLVSGSDDETVKFWEVSSGRCVKTLQVGGKVKSISWNPNPAMCLVALTIEQSVIIVNPGFGDKLVTTNTDTMLEGFQAVEEGAKKVILDWNQYTGKEHADGMRLKLVHPKEVSQVTWHNKGDYFASVMPKGDTMSVLIHQLSRRRSQNPFSKSKGLVQCVCFHPIRPYFFVATQRFVRVYNLLKQELTKKLQANCKWVSSMAVHPSGDNVILGSYDSRLSWFDMDLSTKPYHTLRHHKKALRQVCYHKRYPLFASASDDGSVIVCHGMVYNDLLQNPLIVPVKVLKGHVSTQDLGVLDCVFHPTQPWIFSSGADSTIRLYT